MQWFDALVQGVLLGGMYAQYALGMALMFGVMRIVNISHGDLVREDPSERKEIDLCNLRFLYQGKGSSNAAYNSLPYRPGLLTLVR